jgi:pSer/pThr/pTyr-binding forkhead associated (FHA) protein
MLSMPPVAVQLPPARLTIQQAQGGQQVFRIEKSMINIGRQLSNDIIVEDKRVSRYHAQIKYQPDGQFVIFDLGSTNGITINNTPNMRHHVLHNGDRFTIGSYDFYFERR